jgi:hypothetical protein
MHEENQSTLQSGNACCHSVQNLLSSSLLSKTIKTKIQRTVTLSVVLNEYENWSLTLKEEHTRRVFQNKVLSRIFGPKWDEVEGSGKSYIMRSLVICTADPVLFG